MGKQTLQTILDIYDNKPVVRTTEKSNFNQELEANRPVVTTAFQSTERGKFISQKGMNWLRRRGQIYTIEYVDIDIARNM